MHAPFPGSDRSSTDSAHGLTNEEDNVENGKEELLLYKVDDDDDDDAERYGRRSRFNTTTLTSSSMGLNVLLAALCTFLWLAHRPSRSSSSPDTMYSPAAVAVEYETVVFNSAFPNEGQVPPVYFGVSTPETEEAWTDLLDPMKLELSASEASPLAEGTSRIAKIPDPFVVGLSVYHQLHCLNDLRNKFAPSSGNVTINELLADDAQYTHIFHCIDLLRQSLMCNADLSLVYWEWRPERGHHSPNATTTHICRKWEGIHGWAKDHKIEFEWDKNVLIE